jgi:hypothetical protein
MRRSNHILLAVAVSLLVLAVPGSRASAAESRDGEGSVKIAFPKEESVPVDLRCNKVDLRSVKIDGAPSHHEIHEAREHHSDDTSNLRWIFKCDNEGKHPRKMTIKVKVYSDDNKVLAEDSRTDTISGEKDRDQISVWTKIRTRDYPKADHARIFAECERE